MRALLSSLCLLLALAAPAVAAAATASGRISDGSGGGLTGMQVRLWRPTPKGYQVARETTSGADGAYTITGVAAGTYRLDARMAPGVSGNYGDRWYDVVEPLGDGYIPDYADDLTFADADARTGLDIALPVLGGMNGLVTSAAGTPLGGLLIRVERIGEPRIHHNDMTQAPGTTLVGQFIMRGMVPADDYRIILHDPRGVWATTLIPGPFRVVSDANEPIPTVVLEPSTAVDPYEENDGANDVNSDSIDGQIFRTIPPTGVITEGTVIGPTPDPDWYCFQALAGDRFLIRLHSMLELPGISRPHPFFDPTVGLWSEPENALVGFNDDGSATSPMSFLDVELPSSGRHCVAVSTYPDIALGGANQGSAGPYTLIIDVGNRRPQLSASIGGEVAPRPPTPVTLAEEELLTVLIAFVDPDGDPITVTATLRDNQAALASGTDFTADDHSGAFTWQPSQTAATGSPYTLRFTAADAELTSELDVLIQVLGVNVPPGMPTHLAPTNGALLATDGPDLVIGNASDADLNPLSYQFELYQRGGATPLLAATVGEGAGGQTVWQVIGLPDNTWFTWRARAWDNQADNPYSAWTEPWRFLVDLENEPPTAPVMLKPTSETPVMTRLPVLEAENPTDPEDEPLAVRFLVADDPEFTEIVVESALVPVAEATTATLWQLDTPLSWSATYHARAQAEDSRGLQSPWSAPITFALRQNGVPPSPNLGPPFATGCDVGVEVRLPLPIIEVLNVVDPDGDPVRLRLEIFAATDSPTSATAKLSATRPQSDAATTRFVLDSSPLEDDQLYSLRVAADDGFELSPWRECLFRTRAVRGGSAGGCDCRAGLNPAWWALVLLAGSRRYRRSGATRA